MAKIWIVCKPKPGGSTGLTYDVSPAQEYGELEFIFDAYHNPSIRPAEALERIRTCLEKFNEATDYVVWSGGDPYALLLTGFVMNELGLPVRYLRFERLRQRQYTPGQENAATPPANNNGQKSGYYIPVEMPNSAY